jgi:hypothetical protein
MRPFDFDASTFTAGEAAAITSVSRLEAAGMPPSTSSRIARNAAAQVTVAALLQPGAVLDEQNLARGEPPIKHSRDFASRFLVVNGTGSKRPYQFVPDGEIGARLESPTAEDVVIVLDLQKLASTLVPSRPTTDDS